MSDAEERIRHVLDPILKSMGLDLWGLEFQKQGPKWLLRVYIDREIGGGVTLGDCETVSRDLGTALDVEDIVPHSYTLEVSSPGLDRTLTKPEHFIRFTGSLVKIKTYQPIDREKVFRGKLLGIVGQIVQLQAAENTLLNIPLANIAKANLELDF
jgi:ribosome maturation factor RimP